MVAGGAAAPPASIFQSMARATGKLFIFVERRRYREEPGKWEHEKVQLRGRLTPVPGGPRHTFVDATVGGSVLGINCTAKWGENSSVVALLCSFGVFAFRLNSQTGPFSTARQGEVAQAEYTAAKKKTDTQARRDHSFFFALLS